MPNPQKTKGKRVENEICKIFASTFGLTFKRVFDSGSFFGGSNKYRLKEYSENQIVAGRGDIHVPKELNHLVIECKSRKTFAFNLLFGTGTELPSWIDQLNNDIHKESDIGLLIFKINNKGFFVVFKDENLIIPSNLMVYFHDNTYYIQTFNNEWLEHNKQYLLDSKPICIN